MNNSILPSKDHATPELVNIRTLFGTTEGHGKFYEEYRQDITFRPAESDWPGFLAAARNARELSEMTVRYLNERATLPRVQGTEWSVIEISLNAQDQEINLVVESSAEYPA